MRRTALLLSLGVSLVCGTAWAGPATDADIKSLQSNMSERLKNDLADRLSIRDFKPSLRIDAPSFLKTRLTTAGVESALRGICVRQLADFVDYLYENPKAKALLARVKSLTCAATSEKHGKTPDLVKDRLIFYGRIFPMNDTQFTTIATEPAHSYNLFRKKQNLGGECKAFFGNAETEKDCANE
jgi:hypothetical protein